MVEVLRSEKLEFGRRASCFIHLVYLYRKIFVKHGAFYLQCIGQFTFFHTERLWQERDALNLFVVGKFLLQGFYAFHHHPHDFRIGAEVISVSER
jgi:hypothetical protein